mgnify:CR=1 FL=1
MGEWEKRIGERGESVVSDFLDLIGWGDAQRNVSLPCLKKDKHKCKTHGIDAFFSYQSNLVDRTLDHLVISIKYTTKKYPASPGSKFKEHFTDLAKAMECFRSSSVRKRAGQNFTSVNNARNVGVLFWLTNDRDNRDVVSEVSTVRKIDDLSYENIFVVDDFRAAHIFDTVSWVKSYSDTHDFEFFYPNTGRNINPAFKESAGPVLPVEYVNSPVLPMVVKKNDGKKVFVISSIDEFHVDRLRKLIGLAQNITQDLSSETKILFPDYDELFHENDVKDAKAGFEDKDFTASVGVSCYRDDFRGGVA